MHNDTYTVQHRKRQIDRYLDSVRQKEVDGEILRQCKTETDTQKDT